MFPFYVLIHSSCFFSSLNLLPFLFSETKSIFYRSDSSVEIWNIRSAAHVDRIILPQEGISIQCIIWSGERLFCGTLQGSVIEYDLLSLSPLVIFHFFIIISFWTEPRNLFFDQITSIKMMFSTTFQGQWALKIELYICQFHEKKGWEVNFSAFFMLFFMSW